MSTLKLSGIINESIVDGPGIRYVVFTQGCPHKCEGCHNPHTHDFESGFEKSTDEIYHEILKNPLIKGVTISGGEPFMQAREVATLASKLKEKNYDVMVYTGFNYEHLVSQATEHNGYAHLLKHTDKLVDGKFEMNKKNLQLRFRGSENQRVIDVKQSMTRGDVVLHQFED